MLSKYAKVTVYAKIGPEYPEEWIRDIERYVKVIPFPADSTTSFELVYEGESRVLRVLSKGEQFTLRELNSIKERRVIVNPVSGEIRPEHLTVFKNPSLDVQGFVRELKDKVEIKNVDGSFLNNCNIVHASAEEYKALVNPGTPNILAVTNGSRGGVLKLRDGREIKFEPKRVHTENPTGAGDAFLALLVYGIDSFGIEEGLRFAIDETAKFLKLGLKNYLDRDDDASIG
ncbi:hypothetical protein Py04_1465 [Pyrococcus sp. ST04]|nr:hypothetical protein Py04_1465 [Pyrococcus sp. ST04]